MEVESYVLLVMFMREFFVIRADTKNPSDSINLMKEIKRLKLFSDTRDTDEILILKDTFTGQEHISLTLGNFSRLRDVHSRPPPATFIVVHYAYLVAQGINATLVSINSLLQTFNSQDIKESIQEFPTIQYQVFKRMSKTFMEQRKRNYSTQIPILLTEQISCNFAYSGKTIEAHQDMFSFILKLLRLADTASWICIVVSASGVMVLIGQCARKRSSIQGSIIIASFSVLITCGMSGVTRLKSLIFVTWMFGCIVLTTYYSGVLTSLVISPPSEVTITTFAELIKKNYMLAYGRQSLLDFMRETVLSSLEVRNNSFGDRIADAFRKASVKNYENSEGLLETMIKENVATIVTWQTAISWATKGNTMIATKRIKYRKFYIGEELRFANNIYYIFTGRRKEKMSRIFCRIVEAGLYLIWRKESAGVITSTRVQSRSRIANPTRLAMEMDPVEALGLEGELTHVVYLWIFGLVGSSWAFLFEIFGHKVKVKIRALA